MASPTLHGPVGRTEEERFDAMVGRSDGCWLWQGGIKANGYGCFAIKRGDRWTKANAHRYAYDLWVGPIPPGFEVDHLCHTRACVRPDHLEAVTLAENRRRRNARKTHCIHGHQYTPDNTLYQTDRRDGTRNRYCRMCHNARLRARYHSHNRV